MKRGKIFLFLATLALIGATSGILIRLKSSHHLGKPGIKTSPIAGKLNLKIELPQRAANFESQSLEMPKEVFDMLPKDTSFAQRIYRAPDGFEVLANVVLMGTDRTSIHKPQICLTAQGWLIESSELIHVPMEQPHPYNLPVMKLLAGKKVKTPDGQEAYAHGVYAYWFVADDALTARHTERMWWMAKHLLRTGVLQRWAYVTYFAVCAPGDENRTFQRMKELIVASAPQFQLVPRPSPKSNSVNTASK